MSQGQSLGHVPSRQDGLEMTPLDDLLNAVFSDEPLLRAVLSKPRSAELPRKVTVEPIELRGETAFQFAAHHADRVTHENLPPDDARERLGLLLTDYGQGLLQTADGGLAGPRRDGAAPAADEDGVSQRGTTGASGTCSRKADRSRSSSSSA